MEGAELPPDQEPKHQRILRHVVAKLRDIARSRLSLFGASGHGKKLLVPWILPSRSGSKSSTLKPMISVAGTLVADLIIRPIRAWPGKSQNANVDHIEVLPGGAVANTGMALARLGVPVSAFAAVGEDNLGKIVKESVSRWAARDSVTVIPSSRTTASVVGVSEDGDRCFLSAPGACDQFSLTPEQVENEVASGSRALHIGYAMILPSLDGEPLEKVMRRASQLGALTSLDVTYFDGRPWPDLLKLMPEIDLFCPSLLEASAITGKSNAAEAATALVEAGVRKFVAVTDGARGALIHVVGEGQEFIPAYPVKALTPPGQGTPLSLASLQRGTEVCPGGLPLGSERWSPPWRSPVPIVMRICGTLTSITRN